MSSDPAWLSHLLLSSHLENEKKIKTEKSETLGKEKREKRNLEGDCPPNRNVQERKATKAIPKGGWLTLPSQREIQAHLILIQPDVCQPQGVVCHGVLAFRGTIGSPFPENVSDSGARDDEELAPTHPNLVRSKACISSCLSAMKSMYGLLWN